VDHSLATARLCRLQEASEGKGCRGARSSKAVAFGAIRPVESEVAGCVGSARGRHVRRMAAGLGWIEEALSLQSVSPAGVKAFTIAITGKPTHEKTAAKNPARCR
jgi:hypothetical protein